jgi:hypothetical protein
MYLPLWSTAAAGTGVVIAGGGTAAGAAVMIVDTAEIARD